jgi:hypothetical protein
LIGAPVAMPNSSVTGASMRANVSGSRRPSSLKLAPTM